MQLRYTFRLVPTPEQQVMLARTFGCVRVVFNDGLRARSDALRAGEPYIGDTQLQSALIVGAKATPQRAWLADVSSDALIQGVRDLHAAYRNFFNSVTGKRKGPRVGPPRFRSRRDTRQSFRMTRNGFRLRGNGALYLAKIGEVRVRWSRALPAEPSSVTVIRDNAGRYFASFVVQVCVATLPEVDMEIGLDLGLTSYAVDSRGHVIENPRFLRNQERRLRKAQKALARKADGSANRAKARTRVARAYARVADCRRDWLHKTSTRLIRENQAVYLEDLAVSSLGRTRLAKSVHDAAWGMFRRMLEYKASRHGRHIGIVSRWEPTSRRCSACGVVGGKLSLSVRSWVCGHCSAVHDRDGNAALNILAAGRADRQNACRDHVRPSSRTATVSETGTVPGRRKAARGKASK
ncbi:MAG TPA: transposase [Micromonosporaceae bacterium]|nr:transposase [Micromonosporaceae bacterium]HCU51695.1 transposase [Micromonosporaceae bacterium]